MNVFRKYGAPMCVATMLCGSISFVQSTRVAAQQPTAIAKSNGADARGFETLMARRVSVTLKNVSLKRAIDSVSSLAKVVVQYQAIMLQGYAKPVNIQVVNKPIGIVFEQLLDGTKLHVVSDGQGGLALSETASIDRDSTVVGNITGRVVDSVTGRGISGATVKVAGTKLSALSSDSGRFALHNVPVGDIVLAVRVFGYRPGERSITVTTDHSTTVRIALASAPNVLSGVVTTATGVQSRREIGNDITVINVDSVLRVAPVRNVTDLLANRVPGLTVQRASGVPGAPARIRLRGVGGFPGVGTKSNDPIVIVDGIRIYSRGSTRRDKNLADPDGDFSPPSPIDEIDPNTIETLEVFKGPSATSAWGADAANGVIVITTKRPLGNGKTNLDVALDAGLSQMPGLYAPDNAFVWGHVGVNGGLPVLCKPIPANGGDRLCTSYDSVAHFQALNAPRLSPFATGTEQRASATLRGGTGTTTYSVTASASNVLGYLKMPDFYQDIYRNAFTSSPPRWMQRPDALKSWSGLATMLADPARGLRLTLIGDVSNSEQRQSSANASLPTLSATYVDTVAQLTPVARGGAAAPYYTRSVNRATTTRLNVQGDWTRWNMLTAYGTVGTDTRSRIATISIPYGLPEIYALGAPNDTNGRYSIGHGNEHTRTAEGRVLLFPLSRIRTTLGITATTTETDDNTGFQDTLRPGVSTPSGLYYATQQTSSITTAGWYVEPQLRLSDRLNLTPGFRFDGGNATSGSGFSNGKLKNGIFALFPKLNFSWMAVDPQEQRPLFGFISLLRPRVAFGVAGVQPEPGQNLRLYASDTVSGTPQTYPGITLKSLGNSTLHPERSREVEGGFDVSLWGQRIDLKATAYQKMRTDAILPINLPMSLGGYGFFVNAGRVKNSGEELALDAQLVQTPNVSWFVHASYAANRDRVVALTDTLVIQTQTTSGLALGTRLIPGYPIDGRWARPIMGYADRNGDGRISYDEVSIGDSLVFLGGSQPKYQLPFSTTVSLFRGRVSLDAGFSYTRGVTQFNSGNFLTLQNHLLDGSISQATQAAVWAALACGVSPLSCDGTNPFGPGFATPYGLFQTVNTLRFETASLSYTVPRNWAQRLVRAPSMVVALQGSNLGLWTNYKGKDPDVNGDFTSELNNDGGQLPQPRRWVLHVTLGY